MSISRPAPHTDLTVSRSRVQPHQNLWEDSTLAPPSLPPRLHPEFTVPVCGSLNKSSLVPHPGFCPSCPLCQDCFSDDRLLTAHTSGLRFKATPRRGLRAAGPHLISHTPQIPSPAPGRHVKLNTDCLFLRLLLDLPHWLAHSRCSVNAQQT